MPHDDDIEARVLAAAAAVGAEVETLACDPDFADTAAFCERYGIDPADSANTILVASRTEPVQRAACVVLATTKLDVNGAVRRRLGVKKVSFAPAEDTLALTGMLIGGVTVFGLPPDIPVWVDSRVMERERVVVGGGSRSLKLLLPPAALTRLPTVEVVEGLALSI